MLFGKYTFLLSALVSFVLGLPSCLFNKEEPPTNPEPFTSTVDVGEKTEDPFNDKAFEKYFEDPDTLTEPENAQETTSEESSSEEIAYEKVRSEDPVEQPEPERPSSSSDRPYMVVAGSFSLKENAERVVRKLIKAGYDQAEVVIFNEQEYHSVVAARYDNYEQAKVQATTIENSLGLPAYVHRKRIPKK